MNDKEKERITLMFIDAVKEASEYLSSMDNAHEYDPAFLELWASIRIEPKRQSLLNFLLKDSTYAMRCSEEYLDQLLSKKLRDVIYKLVKKEPGPLNRQARKAVGEVFEQIDTITDKYTVYLPVSGVILQLEEEKLVLGNITLQKMTQERIDEAIESFSTGIMALANIPEEKQQFIGNLATRLKAVFENTVNTVWAVYHDDIQAEPIRAKKRAEEECYKVFDLLRYSLPVLYPTYYPKQFYIPSKYLEDQTGQSAKKQQRGLGVKREQGRYISFGLKEDVGETIRHVIMFSDQPGFNWETKRDDSLKPLVLGAEDIEGMDWIGVFEVSKIISGEENTTNFKRTLLRSLHWYANAQTQMQPEYIFLSLVSSIEAFLNPTGFHEQVTSAVTEGVAVLIGSEEEWYSHWIWWIIQPASPSPFGAGFLIFCSPEKPSLSGARSIRIRLLALQHSRRDMTPHPPLASIPLKRKPLARGKRAPRAPSIVGWFSRLPWLEYAADSVAPPVCLLSLVAARAQRVVIGEAAQNDNRRATTPDVPEAVAPVER